MHKKWASDVDLMGEHPSRQWHGQSGNGPRIIGTPSWQLARDKA
jgi:hypothetical protein